MLEAPGNDLDSNQSLKTGGKKTEKEYEVQLVLMDDVISCIIYKIDIKRLFKGRNVKILG